MSYKKYWKRVNALERAYNTAPEDMKYIWFHKLYAMMLLVEYH